MYEQDFAFSDFLVAAVVIAAAMIVVAVTAVTAEVAMGMQSSDNA